MDENALKRLEEEEEKLHAELNQVDEEIRKLSEQLEVPLPQCEDGFAHVVVVDNVPVIPESKLEKLIGVLRKVVGKQCGSNNPLRPDGIHIPFNKPKSCGFAFLEFQNEDKARLAAQALNGHSLDKSHTFRAHLYNELEELTNVPEVFQPEQHEDFQPKEVLRSWLLDPRPLDQYSINYGDNTEIYWNEPSRQPDPIKKRVKWTDRFVTWSPLGTYFVTVHPQGVQLWGGESFSRILRLPHTEVSFIHFSPNENYLMTFSPYLQENENPKDPQSIIIWDVRTGKSRRGFSSVGTAWPEFGWSHDDKYFARLTPETKDENGKVTQKSCIRIYEASTMSLLGGKALFTGAKDFCWSPTDNVMSLWFPESDNNPARVVLVSIPSRKEIVSKSLFNVSDCRMHWQGAGDYLCVKVDRHTKTKKSTYTNFELFKLRSKNVPIEVLEHKETILAFAWEPTGSRFAIIHSANPSQKLDVTFYDLTEDGVVTLKTLEKRPASHLFWAPQGGFILLAGLRSADGGHLEFYNVNDLETMATEDHFGCSHIVWDPTGRYVTTSISSWTNQQMENGYNIWTFQGKLIHKVLKDRFYQFAWRPRPPTLLSKEKETYIKTHLKEYSSRFIREEHEEKQKALKELQEKRDSVLNEFAAWMATCKADYESTREARRELWGGEASDEDSGWEEYEETVEEVISQHLEYF
mmetsp:Transcript_11158/g.16863  ORF Transcript_11158/g.16863 Transcript_11158/m.16863 type:complete len:692 (-) Transcript_11158:98-2173(-)|eukprot:CAMPEP_0201525264 /NCGR_PEP_ID=MMETSP0161_2-20130828/27503_1 /ASSEMBLY_ACC=CAM_ASM_000251 /TAXON_ID=180227 /ORGANISM="Neoparamoeba aestuarina, Strain SoJaBio B1-5/56/2" /LENGTH=691 /DNA_ID=CAMNT_0047925111 /DNA_START=90 /DNA_END=2165 /DNA_ORIENTATION=+